MTLTLTVRNFGGLEKAAIEVDAVTLVCGPNAAGKSSLYTATALALSSTMLPGKMTKGQAGKLVLLGADRASCTVEGPGGKSVTRWPDCTSETEGEKPPAASRIAVGLIDPCAMTEKEKADTLGALLDVKVTGPDMVEAFDAAGLSAKAAASTFAAVTKDGWDATLKTASEHGAKMKGRWEQIAGAGNRYGTDAASKWLPQGWSEDLSDESDDSLDLVVVKAKRDLEGLIEKKAIGRERLTELQVESAKVPGLKAEVERNHADLKAAQAKQQDAARKLAALPKAAGANLPTDHCPECGSEVAISQVAGAFKLVKAGSATPKAELDKSAAQAKAAKSLADQTQAEVERIAGVQAVANAALAKADMAQKEMLGGAGAGADEAKVNEAREALALAERRLAAFRAKRDADQAHRSVLNTIKIVAILKPEGVRATRLRKGLAPLNEAMATLCGAAKWAAVTIDPASLEFFYGERPWTMAAESERWRIMAITRMAVASLDGSAVVCLDRADVLEDKWQLSLLKAAVALHAGTGIGTLITAMQPAPDAPGVRDLSKITGGRTYWLRDRAAVPLGEVA